MFQGEFIVLSDISQHYPARQDKATGVMKPASSEFKFVVASKADSLKGQTVFVAHVDETVVAAIQQKMPSWKPGAVVSFSWAPRKPKYQYEELNRLTILGV